MKDAFDAHDRHEHTGQKTTLERAVVIGETGLGDVPPAEHLGEQEEGPGILGVAKKKSSGGRGTGKPETGGCSSAFNRAASSVMR